MNLETLAKANELAEKIKDIEAEIGYMGENFIAMSLAVADGRYLSIDNIDPERWDTLKLIIATALKDKLVELKYEFEKL